MAINSVKEKNNLVVFVLTFILLAFFIFLFLPLDPTEDDKIKKIYYVDNISRAQKVLVERFNKQNKGEFEVVAVDLPFTKFSTNERKELLTRALRSKTQRIDIMAVDVIWGPRFERWAHPLNDYFTDEEIDDINPRAMEACFINGKMIAIPMYIDIGLLYFRKDLVSQLPAGDDWINKLKAGLTWDEFVEISEKLKSPDGSFLFAAEAYESLLCIFYETMLNKNVHDVFYQDSLDLDDENVKKSFTLLHDLIYKYKITPPIVTEYDEYKCSQFAINHDIPFIRHWPGFPNDVAAFDKENKIKKFDFAPIPVIKKGEEAGIYGGWNLMISKYSKYPKDALKFIKFILKPENQKLLFSESNYLPVNEEIYQDSIFIASYPRLKKMYQIIHDGKHRPYLEEYTRISDILSYYLNLFLKNEMAMQDAIDMATRQINSKQVFIP